jgi:type IV secretory pathway ATPase VirB11/archaellum biosynthesis ATPase
MLHFAGEDAVRLLACRLAMRLGPAPRRRGALVDAALPDGTRLHAVLPPLVASTTISLRVLARRCLDLPALVACGTVPRAAETILACAGGGPSGSPVSVLRKHRMWQDHIARCTHRTWCPTRHNRILVHRGTAAEI